jgi:transposase
MKGYLSMSQKERNQHLVLDRVVKEELRPCDAARILEITYRHVQRLVRAYRDRGEDSLPHGLRGGPGTHRTDAAIKEKILESYRTNYKDFGPTFASEKLLERDGLTVNPETLRLWLIESGEWTPKKRRGRHRKRRERRACFGDLIQVDGSHHNWFEERGDRCCLMTLVDDATGRSSFLFTRDEGTFAVMAALRGWVQSYGVPVALYTDRLKTYLTDREPTVTEQLAGASPVTQFGRACTSLGIRIIAARSPQAKGRVENKHGLTQDRLVKELRLAGINTIAAANKFLETWLPQINERFGVSPADATDLHRSAPSAEDLDGIFCRHEERSVGNDWVVRYNNKYLQIVRQANLPPSRSAVTVREWEDGRMEVWFKERCLQHKELTAPPKRVKPEKAPAVPKKSVPDAQHPWRTEDTCGKAIRPTKALTEELVDFYLGDGHLPAAVRDIMRNVTHGGDL